MKALRFQTTGICSTHAVLLAVHIEKCIVAIRNSESDQDIFMPDLSSMMVNLCGCGQEERIRGFVESYISGQFKVSIADFLRAAYSITTDSLETFSLILGNTQDTSELAKREIQMILNRLVNHPGILSFTMYPDFK